jgi:hypothetical protein
MKTPDEKREYHRLYRIANKTRLAAQDEEWRKTRSCSIPGCTGRYLGNGYCARHYNRVRRHGDPTVALRPSTRGKNIADRLAFYTRQTRGCWDWIGPKARAGYGRVRVDKIWQLAHRAAYELEHGKIPQGMWVLHRCDNPGCVRPDHLFLGTAADNTADMMGKGRHKPPRRLKEAEVKDILESSARGVTLARKYGVSQSTISSVRRRHTWKHVP